MPQISSHVLDLFKLYNTVKERGGVIKVGDGILTCTLMGVQRCANGPVAVSSFRENLIFKDIQSVFCVKRLASLGVCGISSILIKL